METKSGFASIVGRPNVGKSTFLNTVIGQKVAIVSEKPQTTRNRIQGIYTCEQGQIIFIDTPGIHRPRHKLGEYMVRTAHATAREADVVLYMVSAKDGMEKGDEEIIEFLTKTSAPVFLVVNKIDLVDQDEVSRCIGSFHSRFRFAETWPISAIMGTNVHALIRKILDYLPVGPYYYPPDQVTDQPERFIVAELIREKALYFTREEVPHSLAVEVEEMKERKGNTVYVRAVVFTERDSQKAIVIGKSGSMLKKIGEAARLDIESLLGVNVYLDLWVKVRKGWRNADAYLRGFGYK
ncbi:MAG TPA: GTPase Era [Syntrophothermus lipocalidus]|uniref:GTPase Era n=1 Tax=Syntrophothermus lipocalidus (strain DSM 12680 / TGB-C1) TaxID=643648 RepID=D7CNV9_SYNLT|nr:GTPase Era [Syntrophothermus lipocalidus]ADI02394.1 GTP-binding protein Era [Syntrophothermus lipocalidus DSM 12680]HHV77786.1 GTPase Era [Syntrophothermus lipocalidus]